MAPSVPLPRRAVAAAALCALFGSYPAAHAQAPQTVTVTARTLPTAAVAGFGDTPLELAPLQAGIFGAPLLREAGVASLSGLARLDASVSDAYNSEGYWSALTVRGFVIDNRSNYRRDGLPINAETAIGLQNKERIEVLRGTSGIQAGTSSPGGLVNLVVKRPDGPRRDGWLEVREGGSVTAAVDLGERFGADGALGLRLNASASALRPPTRSADGSSHLLALAADAQIGTDSLLQAEFETSRQSQPSVPAFSLLGDTLPDARTVDPRTNLNNQPWSRPVVLRGDTASLRWQQRLAEDWRFSAHGAVQQLDSDDRVAFPFGCYDADADIYYADRYCPDGRFDLYDYRSDGERRRTEALELKVDGRARTAGVQHHVSTGVLFSRTRERHPRQAFNYAGSGAIDGSVVVPESPALTEENTHRDGRSTEFFLRDRMELSPRWSLWAGLRHTRLQRESVRTDGTEAVSYDQSFTTPWLALSHQWDEATSVYLSGGEGVESDV
ncbi:MAG TPA: TonB-dependent receptor, partial [Rubrivivax sp.]|nr:TonB-dependent receptor [Rubrivivax sp.]